VRRGDIAEELGPAAFGRWIPDEYYEAILPPLVHATTSAGGRPIFHIVSQNAAAWESLKPTWTRLLSSAGAARVDWHIDAPLLVTLLHMMDCDVLVEAPSAFSAIAARYSAGLLVTPAAVHPNCSATFPAPCNAQHCNARRHSMPAPPRCTCRADAAYKAMEQALAAQTSRKRARAALGDVSVTGYSRHGCVLLCPRNNRSGDTGSFFLHHLQADVRELIAARRAAASNGTTVWRPLWSIASPTPSRVSGTAIESTTETSEAQENSEPALRPPPPQQLSEPKVVTQSLPGASYSSGCDAVDPREAWMHLPNSLLPHRQPPYGVILDHLDEARELPLNASCLRVRPSANSYATQLENLAYHSWEAAQRGHRLLAVLPSYLTDEDKSPAQRALRSPACRRLQFECVYLPSTRCMANVATDGRSADGTRVPKSRSNVRHEAPVSFWRAATALGRLAIPSTALTAYMSRQRRAAPEPSLAVHIRQGDSCVGTLARSTPGRRCDDLGDYVSATTTMLRKYPQLRSVVVASDSNESLRMFAANISLQTEVRVVMSAALTFGDELRKAGTTFESHSRRQRYEDEWVPFLDYLTDLHAMADCDALIGKFSWNTDRMVLALMAYRRRCIPPYLSLDRSAWSLLDSRY